MHLPHEDAADQPAGLGTVRSSWSPALPGGLAEAYRRHFEVVPATSEQLRRHGYRIRHEVYCRELGYEPVNADNLEQDAYDAQSIHFLVRSAATGSFVGCARLVLPHPENPSAPLPFERICAAHLDADALALLQNNRRQLAEVSRLAIVSHYRRRRGESCHPVTQADVGVQDGRARLPYLTLGLYMALLALARKQGLKRLFVLTEPALARSLGRLGVGLRIIGIPVNHRGSRLPAVMEVDAIIAGLSPEVRSLFDTISLELDPAASSKE